MLALYGCVRSRGAALGLLALLASVGCGRFGFDPLGRDGEIPEETRSQLFVYAANQQTGLIYGFVRDLESGELIANGNPVAVGPQVRALSVHPTGSALYAIYQDPERTGSTRVAQFDVGTTGELALGTDLAAGVFCPPGRTSVETGGRRVLVNSDGPGQANLFTFTVDAVSGQFMVSEGDTHQTAGRPSGSGFRPQGDFAYTVSSTELDVARYSVDPQSGALTFLDYAASAVGRPLDLAVAPDGGGLYVADGDDGALSQFLVAKDGSLTEIATPFALGGTPRDLEWHPLGDLLVADEGGALVHALVRNTDGSLVAGAAISIPAPQALSVDPEFGSIFVATSDGALHEILHDVLGYSLSPTSWPIGGAGDVSVVTLSRPL